eukprot:g1974.t1
MLKLLGKSSVVVGERKLQTVKRIAEGGFSIVYLVRQTSDADKGKLFALKIVICQTDEQVEAARREMRVHTSCKHPNVLTLIDFDVVQNKNNRGHRDALFLFPFVAGGTVFDLVMSNGMMEVEAALSLFRRISDGDSTKPIVMDLGSAAPLKVVVRTRMDALLLQDKASVESSAPYRAPELFQVPSECIIDGRTDVWSLGGILYFLAFGSSPFESEKEGLLTLSIHNGNVHFPADLVATGSPRQRVKHLIQRALQPDPRRRLTMRQLLEGVRVVQEGRDVGAPPPSPSPAPSRHSPKHAKSEAGKSKSKGKGKKGKGKNKATLVRRRREQRERWEQQAERARAQVQQP